MLQLNLYVRVKLVCTCTTFLPIQLYSMTFSEIIKINESHDNSKRLRNTGSAKYFFLLENALKKLLNIFSNSIFYLKVQSFQLIMKNNFIQMAASVGHAVASMIAPILKQLYSSMAS